MVALIMGLFSCVLLNSRQIRENSRLTPHSALAEPRAMAKGQEPSSSHIQIQRPRGHRSLSDFNEVPIRIADIAPYFRYMDFRLSDKFRASRGPKVVVAPDVGHAQVQEAAEKIQ